MTKSTATIEIQASPEKVFAFLVSEKANDIWKEWVVTKWASDGPVGIGSTAHSVGMGRNKGGEWNIEVTEFVKNQKMTMRSVGTRKRALDSTNSFVLETTTSGTMVTYSIDYRMPYSILGKMVDRLMLRKGLEMADNRMMGNLKAALES
jgi:uncharacterized protein YndB with AHSA1/START domain